MERSYEMLDEVIKEDIQVLSEYEHNSQGREKVISELTQLYKIKTEELKVTCENEAKMEALEREDDFRKAQLAEQVKDRYTKILIAGAEVLIPITVFAGLVLLGYRLEDRDRVISSPVLKVLLGRIRFGK